MIDNKRRMIDLFQNLLITLLSVSAVLLFARTQMYSLEDSFLDNLFDAPAASAGSTMRPDQMGTAPLSVPVRVAISGEGVYGRYGDLTLTTSDETFAPLSTLLTEAMGSAYDLSASSGSEFLAALSRTSVYYDFLSTLPVSVLADLAEVPASDNAISARYLVIAAGQNDTAQLLMWDGERTYLRFETAVSAVDLDAVVNRYELGSAHFAFD